MMKRKRLIVFLVAVSMMIASMFSGMPVSAASGADTDAVASDAELAAKYLKQYTIRKKNGKYYYFNSKGKISKTAGWKTNVWGDYTYYVGKKGYVRYQIKNNKLYKWNNSTWKKVSLKKYKNGIIKVGDRYFYVNEFGIIQQTYQWNNTQESMGTVTSKGYITKDYFNMKAAYCVGTKGYVTHKVKNGNLYKWKNGKWKKVKLKKNHKYIVGDGAIFTNSYSKVKASKYDSGLRDDTIASSQKQLEAMAYETMDLINEERTKAGLSLANKADDVLMQVAKIRAKQISKSFAHDVDEEKLLYEINPDYYYHYGYCGEIIATSDSPERAVTQWMESKGHRHFILQEGDNENPDDFYVSAGVYYDAESNCYYYAVIFWHYHEYIASEDV